MSGLTMEIINTEDLVTDGINTFADVFTVMSGDAGDVVRFFKGLLSGEIILINDPFLHTLKSYANKAIRAGFYNFSLSVDPTVIKSELFRSAYVNAGVEISIHLTQFLRKHTVKSINYQSIAAQRRDAKLYNDPSLIAKAVSELLMYVHATFTEATNVLSGVDAKASALLSGVAYDLYIGKDNRALVKYLLALGVSRGNKVVINALMNAARDADMLIKLDIS